MGVTRTETHHDGADDRRPAGEEPTQTLPPVVEAPTEALIAAPVGDRCPSCGAPLASDQRYCVECGTRRGKSRFSATVLNGQQPQPAATSRTPGPSGPPRRRPSSGATLIAGIATLLLALGVGVEIGKIGKSNNSSNAKAGQPTIIYGNGANTGAASTGTTSTSAAATSGSGKGHHKGKASSKKSSKAASTPKPTKAAVQKASHAASSVLGGGSGQSNNTVTTGQSCAAGSAGCQNGHFTGGFFGGG